MRFGWDSIERKDDRSGEIQRGRLRFEEVRSTFEGSSLIHRGVGSTLERSPLIGIGLKRVVGGVSTSGSAPVKCRLAAYEFTQ